MKNRINIIAPKKAPAAWWNAKMKEVKKSMPDYTDEQVRGTVGKIWWEDMSETDRQKVLKTEKKSSLKKTIAQLEPEEEWKPRRKYTIDEDILEGMARAFFVSAWADWQEEYGEENLSGVELMDVAPETEQVAYDAARDLYDKIEEINPGIELAYGVFEGRLVEDKDEFGHYLAMEAMGTGVAWSDSHPEHGLEVPWVEFSYLDLDPEKYPTRHEASLKIFVAHKSVEPNTKEEIFEMLALNDKDVPVASFSGTADQIIIQAQAHKISLPLNKVSKAITNAITKSPAKRISITGAFPNLLSNDAKKWIQIETQRRASNYGTPATPEQADAYIDRAAEEVTKTLADSIRDGVQEVINEARGDIQEVLKAPEVGLVPPVAPTETLAPPPVQGPPMLPEGASLRIDAQGSNWATEQAESVISNEEGLYNIALELIQQSDSWSELALKLEEEIKPLFPSYFDRADLESVDWHALAGELFEW